MPRIEYFLSTISPYTYLAGEGLEQIAARHGAEIVYRPFDIMAVFARTGGLPVGQRHPSRQEYRLQDLRRSAAMSGMPLNLKPRHWPTNAAPSSYAIIAAQASGGGDTGQLVRGILAACWAEERDIAEDEVIADCLTRAGFPPDTADKGLLAGAETYGRNTEDAVLGGVFGAPTYVIGDQVFWGQDRLSHLDAHLSGKL